MFALGWLLLLFGLPFLVFGTLVALGDYERGRGSGSLCALIGDGFVLMGAWMVEARGGGWFLDFILWGLIVAAFLGVLISLLALSATDNPCALISLAVCVMTILVGGWLKGWWFSAPVKTAEPASTPQPDTLETLNKKLQEWQEKQQAIEQFLARLAREKGQTIRKLRDLGVTGPGDLKGRPQARLHAEELQEIVTQIALAQQKRAERKGMIERMGIAVRRYERKVLLREAGVTDQELNDLYETIATLDRKLTATSEQRGAVKDLKIEEVLEMELQNKRRE